MNMYVSYYKDILAGFFWQLTRIYRRIFKNTSMELKTDLQIQTENGGFMKRGARLTKQPFFSISTSWVTSKYFWKCDKQYVLTVKQICWKYFL